MQETDRRAICFGRYACRAAHACPALLDSTERRAARSRAVRACARAYASRSAAPRGENGALQQGVEAEAMETEVMRIRHEEQEE